MCVCVYIYIYIYIHTHTYIFDFLETIYELPLLPNNTASETFLHNRERCELLTVYLSPERRPDCDWANMGYWTKRFTVQ